MKKTYCDHCGAEIKDGVMAVQIIINDAHLEKHDLCRKCIEGFIDMQKEYFRTIDLRRKR